jgi:hypothetical protein
VVESDELDATLLEFLRKCLFNEQPSRTTRQKAKAAAAAAAAEKVRSAKKGSRGTVRRAGRVEGAKGGERDV